MSEAFELCTLAQTGQVNASRFPTHRFVLDEFLTAYDVFAHPAETSALKVVLNRPS